MRLDSFPADGEFACSDPDLVLKRLIMGAGDIAILEPTHSEDAVFRATAAFLPATNLWLANHWLDPHNNLARRWRGSSASPSDPQSAVAEIKVGPATRT